MESYRDSQMIDDDEGPIIQEIPDALMVGDYIEIHGICRGPEIIVQLLSRDDPSVLPLHVRMAAGGPVLVKSQSKEKVERQEHNVRMGLQPNLDFELCIYAMEEGYEVKLNKHTVCVQKHLVKLEDVSAISMDGDADFTSVEFKDIYGDEEDENHYAHDAPEPGMMRVQEMRESFSRHRGSPILIRSSIRRSQRSNRESEAARPTWSTSADLSRPDYDVDPQREISARNTMQPVNQVTVSAPIPVERRTSLETPSPKTKSRFSWKPGSRKSLTVEEDKNVYSPVGGSRSHILPGAAHAGTYRPIEEDQYRDQRFEPYTGSLGTLNASSASLADSKKKKRGSLFGKLRKSKGSETDLSIQGSEGTKKRGIRNPFKRKSVTIPSTGDVRQSTSMPDVSGRESSIYNRLSMEPDRSPQQRYFGSAADRAPVRGPVPKAVCKQSAPEIAGYLAGQKAVPEFENFTLTDRELREGPTLSYAVAPTSVRASTHGEVPSDRKLKGSAPELADVLLDQKRAGFDQSATLTSGQATIPAQDYARESLYADPYASPRKLQGSAPEVASSLDQRRYPSQTELIYDVPKERTDAQYSRPPTIITAPAGKPPSGKLKGPAPEIAAELYDTHRKSLNMYPETTITGTEAQMRQSNSTIERPKFDRDPVRSQGIVQEQPSYQVNRDLTRSQPIVVDRPDYQNQPVYSTRPVSVDRYQPTRKDSDVSSIHSDGGYYLDVGRSDYYLERKRSLKNYQSRRSRKAQQRFGGSQDDSTHSSVSSLKDTDRVIIPRKGRTNIDSRQQVNSWLNGYTREPEIQPSQQNRQRVFAAAPVIEQAEPVDLALDKEELRKSKNCANIPLALTPGRSAVLMGHFLGVALPDQECFVQLRANTTAEFEKLLFGIARIGKFSIYGVKNGRKFEIAKYNLLENAFEACGTFTLEFYARSHYFAVSLNDFLSAIIRNTVDPALFEQIEMLPCSNAELDYFSVASELTIPITIPYPETSHRDTLQSIILNTRLDADAKRIVLEFETQTNNSFDLILDLADGYVYAKAYTTKDKALVEETARQSIPFVPEQIRRLVVFRKNNEDTLTVLANQKEIFQQPLPLPKPYGKLKHVRLSGDMILLGTRFE